MSVQKSGMLINNPCDCVPSIPSVSLARKRADADDSAGKESACGCRRHKVSIRGSVGCTERKNGNPL